MLKHKPNKIVKRFQNTAPCSMTEFNTNTICPEPVDQGTSYQGLQF